MANRINIPLLKTYISTYWIKAVVNFISPTKHNSAIADIVDTLTNRHTTVADMATLNALTYGTDFGENDIRTVTTDSDGVTGNYHYVFNNDAIPTPKLEWVKMGSKTGNVHRNEVATIDLRDSLVLGTDFNTGDYVAVTANAYGQRVMCRYVYDSATSANKWIEFSLLPNIMT